MLLFGDVEEIPAPAGAVAASASYAGEDFRALLRRLAAEYDRVARLAGEPPAKATLSSSSASGVPPDVDTFQLGGPRRGEESVSVAYPFSDEASTRGGESSTGLSVHAAARRRAKSAAPSGSGQDTCGSDSEGITFGPLRTDARRNSLYSITPRDCWLVDEDLSVDNLQVAPFVSDKFGSTNVSNMRMGDEVGGGCESLFVIRPSSKRRIMWDILSFILMGWDAMLLPMMAFQLSSTPFSDAMDWVTAVFWTLDTISGFFVAFQSNGLTELRLRRIMRRYATTWFVFDIALVTIDWVMLLGPDKDSTALLGFFRTGKAVRLVRVLRMLRLLRIFKMVTILSEFSDFLQTEELQTLFGVAKLVAGVTVLNHWIACIWYAIGRAGPRDRNWISALVAANGGDPITTEYAYLTSLHWSMTQFTPASMEVVPKNWMERVCVIVVIILALVIFSTIVSSITQAMTYIRKLNEEHIRQQDLVRRYITEHRVSLDLGNRVLQVVRKRRARNASRLSAKDVQALGQLPQLLRYELAAECYTPLLIQHPFFQLLHLNEPRCVSSLCHRALSECTCLANSEVFAAGHEAPSVLFVVEGCLSFSRVGSERVDVSPKAVLSEFVLWVHWKHRGVLISKTKSLMVSLCAETFCKLASACSTASFVRKYALELVDLVVNPDNGVGFYDDLGPTPEELEEIALEAWDGAVINRLSDGARSHYLAAYWGRSTTDRVSDRAAGDSTRSAGSGRRAASKKATEAMLPATSGSRGDSASAEGPPKAPESGEDLVLRSEQSRATKL